MEKASKIQRRDREGCDKINTCIQIIMTEIINKHPTAIFTENVGT